MAQMVGADVGQLRHLAAEFGRAADEFSRMEGSLTAGLARAPWRGPSGDQFRVDWHVSHRVRLAMTADFLRAAQRALLQQAEQPEAASSTDGAGAGSHRGSGRSGDAAQRAGSEKPQLSVIGEGPEATLKILEVLEGFGAIPSAFGPVLAGFGSLISGADLFFHHPYEGAMGRWETAADALSMAGGFLVAGGLVVSAGGVTSPAGAVMIGVGTVLTGVGLGIDVMLKGWEDFGRDAWHASTKWAETKVAEITPKVVREAGRAWDTAADLAGDGADLLSDAGEAISEGAEGIRDAASEGWQTLKGWF